MTGATLGLLLARLPVPPERWREVGEVAAAAEDEGAEAFWLTDHLLWHEPTVEPMAALGLVAAATQRCRLGPCVLQLPLREPAAVAKSAAFLEAVAPGRVVLGVGTGEHRGEYDAAGVGERYARRGALLDAGIAAIRSTWAEQGRYGLAPGGAVPLWVGGRSDAAVRRAARTGDAWVPHLCRVSWFEEKVRLLAEEVEASGRPPGAVTAAVVIAVAVEVPGGPRPAERVEALARTFGPAGAGPSVERLAPVVVAGSPKHCAKRVGEFFTAGARHVALMPAGPDPIGQLAAVRQELDV